MHIAFWNLGEDIFNQYSWQSARHYAKILTNSIWTVAWHEAQLTIILWPTYFLYLRRELVLIGQNTVRTEPLGVEDATGRGDADDLPAGETVGAKDQRVRGGAKRIPRQIRVLQQPVVN